MNNVEFEVTGRKALFTFPEFKTGGEKAVWLFLLMKP